MFSGVFLWLAVWMTIVFGKPVKDMVEELRYIVTNVAHGRAYKRTADFVDRFGWRMVGTPNLEAAIDDLRGTLEALGFDDVHHEPVSVPHWVRGEEFALLMEPLIGGVMKKLPMKSFGWSVATPPEGIIAPVLVITGWAELLQRRAEVAGKIVLFVYPWQGYNNAVIYRLYSHQIVAKFGGVASLIRSAASFSLASPHTGCLSIDAIIDDPALPQELWGNYSGLSVPTAGLTVEDAEMLLRMTRRGQAIQIHLSMSCATLPNSPSRNTIASLRGSTHPDQVVLISGHIDSWDVGQGAMDNAVGMFVALEALALLKERGLQFNRTIRFVAFVSEEWGEEGARQYFADHKDEQMVLVSELDEGIWNVDGIIAAASEASLKILRDVGNVLETFYGNAGIVLPRGDVSGLNGLGLDVSGWTNRGVPTIALAQHPTTCWQAPLGTDGHVAMDEAPPPQHFQGDYFFYHHSDADTMSLLDPYQMDRAVAVLATYAYAAANLDEPLPQGNFVPQPQPSGSSHDPYPNTRQYSATVGWIITLVTISGVAGIAIGACSALIFVSYRRSHSRLP